MRAHRASPHWARRLQVDLGIAGLGLVAVTVALGVHAIHVDASSAHSTVIAGHGVTYPAVNVAAVVVLVLAALGVAVLVLAARLGWREICCQRRVLALLLGADTLAGHPDVTVIQERRPIAFCAGHVRPRVCLSTGALAVLGPEELDAVLAHERHHQALRDPLRLAVARVLGGALFFLPVLRSIADSYAAAIELDADRAALRASGGSRAPLAAALLALSASGDLGMVGIAPERVDQLTGDLSPFRAPLALLGAAVITTSAVLIVEVGLAGRATVHTSLNVPMLSSKPCVVVLAVMPLLLVCGALILFRRSDR